MGGYRRFVKYGIVVTMVLMALIALANFWIIQSTKDQVYYRLEDMPKRDVALVLGTSKYSTTGGPNQYFKYRMKAAADLYRKGQVKHLIVSGDNRTKYYNEPKDMRGELIKLGVPAEAITLDFAGFRTLDSVIRCKQIFGQEKITIVTQDFHSYRALFISDFYDIDAAVYAARDLPFPGSLNVVFREIFARPKAVIDLYFLREKPHFLGPREFLEID